MITKTAKVLLWYLLSMMLHDKLEAQSLLANGVPCYAGYKEVKSDTVKLTIGKYLSKIEADALPLLAIVTRADTTTLYLSAVISANAIKNSPPSCLTSFGGREVAVYTGEEAVFTLPEECINSLVNKYRQILQVDKLNASQGLEPGTVRYYGYEHIWVKITLYKGRIIAINDKGELDRSIPYFKFSF